MKLWCAQPGDVRAFGAAWPLLRRALKDDTRGGVWRALRTGNSQLWLAADDRLRAACVTQSGEDLLHIHLAGGDACDWRALGNGIAAAATGRFKRMTIDGRPGWRRVLDGFAVRDDGVLERVL